MPVVASWLEYGPWTRYKYVPNSPPGEGDADVYVESGEGYRHSLSVDRGSVKTPNYGKVKSKPWTLPMNPFSFERWETHWPNGRVEYAATPTSGTFIYQGFLSHRLPAYNDRPSQTALLEYTAAQKEALNQCALNKLLSKAKDSKVNLMQALGERRQTADLLATTATRVLGAVTSLKRGDLRGAARHLGTSVTHKRDRGYRRRHSKDKSSAVSSGWLELQYGWLPLLSDVYGSAELIAQKVMREARNRVSARCGAEEKVEWMKYPGWLVTRTRKYHVKYVVYFQTPSESSHLLAQVGISNPTLLAWELLPWSFVVDWFIPIGNFLSSWDATNGLAFDKGCVTVFEEATVTEGNHSRNVPCGSMLLNVSNYDYSQKRVRCNRTVLTAWPAPTFPTFKNPLSLTHAANAIALLRGAFR